MRGLVQEKCHELAVSPRSTEFARSSSKAIKLRTEVAVLGVCEGRGVCGGKGPISTETSQLSGVCDAPRRSATANGNASGSGVLRKSSGTRSSEQTQSTVLSGASARMRSASHKPIKNECSPAARAVDAAEFPVAMEKSPEAALWTERLKPIGDSCCALARSRNSWAVTSDSP